MSVWCLFFFFNDTATTEIYTLSLHDALPIFGGQATGVQPGGEHPVAALGEHRLRVELHALDGQLRSEEHTSELQSRQYLVCRLLLEKKKKSCQYDIDVPTFNSHSFVRHPHII